MKDQRGSVTVISLAMLLFLMVVAVAWLPMMTMEKTAAASDYREQQAWNAAEAGYKRAVAALSNKNNDWRWLTPEEYIRDSDSANFAHLSIDGNKVDQDEIWYAVSIMGNNADIVSGYIPEEDVVYQITAVGSCQGFLKVIRKTYVLGDDDSSGGGDRGCEETLELPGLVQAGGTVTITNNQAGELNGDLYGSGFFDSSGNQFSSGHTQGTYPNTLKTHIPESVFQKENYQNLQDIPNDYVLKSLKNYFWDLSETYSDWFALNARNAGGMVIFIDNSSKSEINTNGISGPSTGLPVTIIFTNPVVINGKISGNVRMFFASDFTLGNFGDSDGLIMFMSNGEMKIKAAIKNGFLSSDKNIIIANQAFYGQAQVKGNFETKGTIHYSDAVLKAPGFTVPKGMN
ncbi:pilus assembly PilX family protein [Phascolarctobacterium faecium]|uniref:pilus assembly PilX family protein n=1 Tax=Phascolarctobacterium faecium TaxID=33025 RepID=UPI003AB6910A